MHYLHLWPSALPDHQCWAQWFRLDWQRQSHRGWWWSEAFLKTGKRVYTQSYFGHQKRFSGLSYNFLGSHTSKTLLTNKLWFLIGHDLIKYVVASFSLQLESNSRFLQQIWKVRLNTVKRKGHTDNLSILKCHTIQLRTRTSSVYSQRKDFQPLVFINLHVSISAEASLPVAPKWILINLPLKRQKEVYCTN